MDGVACPHCGIKILDDWWEVEGRSLIKRTANFDEGVPLPNIMPSAGAFLVLGLGLVVVGVIAAMADKNDSDPFSEAAFVLAIVLLFVGVVRLIARALRRARSDRPNPE